MCFGGKPKIDDSIQRQQMAEAAEARQREQEREGRIRSGTTKIDSVFGGFNDDYYDTRRQSYLDFYQPQLDDQFADAKEQLTYALARAGTLNSTMAADKTADLTKRYDTQRATLLSQADDDVASAKSRINSEKSALVSQLNATGDADRVSNEALARTQQIGSERPSYSPLGDIFSGFAAGIGNYMDARANAATSTAYFGNGGKKAAAARTVT